MWEKRSAPIPIDDIADSYFGLHVRERSPQEMCEAPGAPELGPGDTLSGLRRPGEGVVGAELGRAGCGAHLLGERSQTWRPKWESAMSSIGIGGFGFGPDVGVEGGEQALGPFLDRLAVDRPHGHALAVPPAPGRAGEPERPAPAARRASAVLRRRGRRGAELALEAGPEGDVAPEGPGEQAGQRPVALVEREAEQQDRVSEAFFMLGRSVGIARPFMTAPSAAAEQLIDLIPSSGSSRARRRSLRSGRAAIFASRAPWSCG